MGKPPVLLDLFCGAGGAAMGYYRAGFAVLGVDITPQPNYPFGFVQMDALDFLAEKARFWNFDAIHASPPCQHYLSLTRVNESLGRTMNHPDLIAVTRKALRATQLPYIIENVRDAKRQLIDPIKLCGTSFDLPLHRHRFFESNINISGIPCAHYRFTERKYWTSFRPKGAGVEYQKSPVVQVYGIGSGGKHHWPAAMGIDWMTYAELAEAIPPSYTEHLGHQLITALGVINA